MMSALNPTQANAIPNYTYYKKANNAPKPSPNAAEQDGGKASNTATPFLSCNILRHHNNNAISNSSGLIFIDFHRGQATVDDIAEHFRLSFERVLQVNIDKGLTDGLCSNFNMQILQFVFRQFHTGNTTAVINASVSEGLAIAESRGIQQQLSFEYFNMEFYFQERRAFELLINIVREHAEEVNLPDPFGETNPWKIFAESNYMTLKGNVLKHRLRHLDFDLERHFMFFFDRTTHELIVCGRVIKLYEDLEVMKIEEDLLSVDKNDLNILRLLDLDNELFSNWLELLDRVLERNVEAGRFSRHSRLIEMYEKHTVYEDGVGLQGTLCEQA